MWWAVSILLLALWLLGLMSGAALGWWIHQLFLFAVIALLLGALGSVLRARAAPANRQPARTAGAIAPGDHG